MKSISYAEKIKIYEAILHRIQLSAEVTGKDLAPLISLICAWSWAHRSGNGEHSEKEQNQMIDSALRQIDDYIHFRGRYEKSN